MIAARFHRPGNTPNSNLNESPPHPALPIRHWKTWYLATLTTRRHSQETIIFYFTPIVIDFAFFSYKIITFIFLNYYYVQNPYLVIALYRPVMIYDQFSELAASC